MDGIVCGFDDGFEVGIANGIGIGIAKGRKAVCNVVVVNRRCQQVLLIGGPVGVGADAED